MNGPRRLATQIHFVTGTGTGVGKTVLSACLLYFFRQAGFRALAMKPFASGNRSDSRVFQEIQHDDLTRDECCPFYSPIPLAPLAAMRARGRNVGLRQVLRCITRVARRCQVLVIEGIGGVMVPLGRGYMVKDLMSQLDCQVWVAATNRLGTVNHSLLTLEALRQAGTRSIRLVLMDQGIKDASSVLNGVLIRKLTGGIAVGSMPYLGPHPADLESLERNWKKIKKVLAPLLRSGNFCARFPKGTAKLRQKRS